MGSDSGFFIGLLQNEIDGVGEFGPVSAFFGECGAAFFWIALSQGGIGLSWDALNHHIYLGWMVAHPRLDMDFLAAGYQSFQYPLLYWPAYTLAVSGASATPRMRRLART